MTAPVGPVRAHPPWGATDPARELAKLIATGAFGISPETAQQAIRSVEPTRPGQLRLLWALADIPGLLTGRGAEGPPKRRQPAIPGPEEAGPTAPGGRSPA